MTSRQKNIALLIGFLLVILLSYLFAIRNTLEAKSKLTALQIEKKLFNSSENKLNYLNQHNNYLDSILKLNEIYANVSFQQTILNKISKYTEENKLKISSFNIPHIFKENQKKLTTYTLEVQGNFIPLLKFLNYFENQRLGTIVSVNFMKKKNYRRNRNYLTVKIYLQKLKN